MRPNLPTRIICIDGLRGSGKTTQANRLKKKFKELNIPILSLKSEDNLNLIYDNIKKTDKFLKENKNGMVVKDGSVARMIVIDLLNGIFKEKIIEKYRKALYQYACLMHKYGLISFLIISDDIETFNQRILSRNRLLKNNELGIEDLKKEKDILNRMKSFDDHIISGDIKFIPISIDKYDTILEIEDKIWKYLEKSK